MPLQFTFNNITTLLDRPAPRGRDTIQSTPDRPGQEAGDVFDARAAPPGLRGFLPTYEQVGWAWTAMCAAAQPWTHRKFATNMSPCDASMTEAGLEKSIKKHNAHTLHVKRLPLFDLFNTHLAPRLTLEESFLQVLAQRFAYTQLNVSTWAQSYYVDCYVTTDLNNSRFEDTHSAYHTSYHVHEREENQFGCTAFWLEPGTSPESHSSAKNRIILFRGTYNHGERDCLAQHVATGWLTNLDPTDIGHRAFEKSATTVKGWVRQCLAKDHPVVIVGHSLGGALSQQLLASLTEAEQRKCRLVTFGSPGVSQSTVNNIYQESQEETRIRTQAKLPAPIKMVWHEADPVVHLFGACFPQSEGTRILAKVEWNEIVQTHSRLYLLIAEAWRGEIYYRKENKPTQRVTHFEYFRQFFGQFTASRATAAWPFH